MNSKTPLISVIMPVYNTCEDWLRQSIESILGQSFTEFEYIIILDAPSDNSASIVREYAAKDKRITVLENPSNYGIVRCLNLGIANACGKLIARMDSDDISMPNRLDLEMKYMEEHGLDIVGSRVVNIDEIGHSLGISPKENDNTVYELLNYVNVVSHPTWLVRKGVFDRLDGYRDILACEDYDFLLRAKSLGMKMGICDEILLQYRTRSSGISGQSLLRQHLTSKYLQSNQARINDIKQYEIDQYLSERLNPKSQNKYQSATVFLNSGVSYMKAGKYLQAITCTLKAAITCRYALCDIRQLFCVNRIRKKLSQ